MICKCLKTADIMCCLSLIKQPSLPEKGASFCFGADPDDGGIDIVCILSPECIYS